MHKQPEVLTRASGVCVSPENCIPPCAFFCFTTPHLCGVWFQRKLPCGRDQWGAAVSAQRVSLVQTRQWEVCWRKPEVKSFLVPHLMVGAA